MPFYDYPDLLVKSQANQLRKTKYGALGCVIAGTGTRLIFFVLMPKMFGSDRTLLYIKNTVFTADFDGFPNPIAPLVGLVSFIAVSLLTNDGKKLASD